jgi:hypothetical protein
MVEKFELFPTPKKNRINLRKHGKYEEFKRRAIKYQCSI